MQEMGYMEWRWVGRGARGGGVGGNNKQAKMFKVSCYQNDTVLTKEKAGILLYPPTVQPSVRPAVRPSHHCS